MNNPPADTELNVLIDPLKKYSEGDELTEDSFSRSGNLDISRSEEKSESILSSL